MSFYMPAFIFVKGHDRISFFRSSQLARINRIQQITVSQFSRCTLRSSMSDASAEYCYDMLLCETYRDRPLPTHRPLLGSVDAFRIGLGLFDSKIRQYPVFLG